MNKAGYILAFVAGAGVGVLASMTYFKKKYELIADEEIESVKAAYSKTASASSKDVDNIIDEIEEVREKYGDIIETAGYVEDEIIEDHPREEVGGVYEISEEDYSETELNYEKATLQYFLDDDILFNPDESMDENGGIVVEQTIGDEGINLVRTSDDTRSLFFRNDTYGIDYEVQRVSGSYYEDR